MGNRLKRLLAALVALVVVIVVVRLTTDLETIGATFNFFWRTLVSSISWSLQGLRELIILMIGRRAWGVASIITSVGFGYLLRVFLSEAQARKVHGWREKLRRVLARAAKWWNELTVIEKILISIVAIFLQITLLPLIAEYVILFPVTFLVPTILKGARRFYGWLADTIVGTLYRNYFGHIHNRIMRKVYSVWIIRIPRGVIRLARLQFLTAWRLWRHDPRYRDTTGKRWSSPIEPWRLWWRRELNTYVGRPLCSGPRKEKKK